MLSTKACLVLVLALSFLIVACGDSQPEGGDVAVADAEAETDRDVENRAAATLDRQGWINALSLQVTGGVDTTITQWGDAISMAGGCDGNSPISLGFQEGNFAREDEGWAYIAFDTADAVGTGETGTFDVEEIRWDHGVRVVTLAGGTSTRVPNRFTGSGTLTLTTHRATMQERRMQGTLRGDALTNDGGTAVSLVAEFDINLSCGVGS